MGGVAALDRLRQGSARVQTRRASDPTCSWKWRGCQRTTGSSCKFIPGVWRGHDTDALARFGPDLGADFPVPTGSLPPCSVCLLQVRVGPTLSGPSLSPSTRRRSLASWPQWPAITPGLWLGAPWWFLDAPDAMSRFWAAVTESAGFGKSAGFVDDTRAYCSIPARHDLARRAHCAFLARLVAEHRLERRRRQRAGRRFCLPSAQDGFPPRLSGHRRPLRRNNAIERTWRFRRHNGAVGSLGHQPPAKGVANCGSLACSGRACKPASNPHGLRVSAGLG